MSDAVDLDDVVTAIRRKTTDHEDAVALLRSVIQASGIAPDAYVQHEAASRLEALLRRKGTRPSHAGSLGGFAAAAAMTPEQRRDRASAAAKARWAKP